MNEALKAIQDELTATATAALAITSSDEPLSIAHGNWSFPGVTRKDLADQATSLAKEIEERGPETLASGDSGLADIPRKLAFLRSNTVPQLWSGNAALAVTSYTETINAVRRAIGPHLAGEVDAQARAQATASQNVKRLSVQLRGIQARVASLEPRSANLDDMVTRIEQAHDAADQLPTDLESLAESAKRVADILKEADKDRALILAARESSHLADLSLKASSLEAATVIERSQAAYSAATSQGLAAAFSERSDRLAVSMWTWVAGLIIALVLGGIFGSHQLQQLAELTKLPNTPWPMVLLNLTLALLSVGAPIWFGWLSTKQIGQRFRLSEDYAFKASISRAYEGYRREAARIDKDLEARLLASALDRLDELPLRLVENDSHGSPWHELASSQLMKDALKLVPDFADSVSNLAKSALAQVGRGKNSPTPLPDLTPKP